MAPFSIEEQFNFLISCIRYSNIGKVDFDEVAKECVIISKGAAAKRYERMMKAHGIHHSQTSIRDTLIPSRPKPTSAATPSKKRKLNAVAETNLNADDDEVFSDIKAERYKGKVKSEETGRKVKVEDSRRKVKAEVVKEASGSGCPDQLVKGESIVKEESSVPIGEETKPSTSGPTLNDTNDTSLMNDFLAFGAYANQDSGSQAGNEGVEQEMSTRPNRTTNENYGRGVQESIVIAD